MTEHAPEEARAQDYREGLRMAHPPDPVELARERELLAELETKGWGERTRAYLKFAGPGYLQSAFTLGGGTAAASLFAGAAFGYQLLWVAPVAMLLGVIMLSAVAYQTLSTGMRPFDAMRRYAGAPFAWGWALGALRLCMLRSTPFTWGGCRRAGARGSRRPRFSSRCIAGSSSGVFA